MASNQVPCHWSGPSMLCHWIIHHSIGPYTSYHWIRLHVTGSNFMSLDRASFYRTIYVLNEFTIDIDYSPHFTCIWSNRMMHDPVIWIRSSDMKCNPMAWRSIQWHEVQPNDVRVNPMIWSPIQWCEGQSNDMKSDPMTWSPIQWHEVQSNDMKSDSMTWRPIQWHDLRGPIE